MQTQLHPRPPPTNMDVTHEVSNREELIAAINSAVYTTYAESKGMPIRIKVLGTRTEYKFPEGIPEDRAREITRAIRKTPAAAFRGEECKGFEIEPGVFSGCDASAGDCPVCGR